MLIMIKAAQVLIFLEEAYTDKAWMLLKRSDYSMVAYQDGGVWAFTLSQVLVL